MRSLILLLFLISIQVVGQHMEFQPMQGFTSNSSFYNPQTYIHKGIPFLIDQSGINKLEAGSWKYIALSNQEQYYLTDLVANGQNAIAVIAVLGTNPSDKIIYLSKDGGANFSAENLPSPYNTYQLKSFGFAGDVLCATVSAVIGGPVQLIISNDFGKTWDISPYSTLITNSYFQESSGSIFFTYTRGDLPTAPIAYFDGTTFNLIPLTGLENEHFYRDPLLISGGEIYWVLRKNIFETQGRLYQYNKVLSKWVAMQSPVTGTFAPDLLGTQDNSFPCSLSGLTEEGQLFFLSRGDNGSKVISSSIFLSDYSRANFPTQLDSTNVSFLGFNSQHVYCFTDSSYVKFEAFQLSRDLQLIQPLDRGFGDRDRYFDLINNKFYFFPFQYADSDGGSIKVIPFDIPLPPHEKQLIIRNGSEVLLVLYNNKNTGETENGCLKTIGSLTGLYLLNSEQARWNRLPDLYEDFGEYDAGSSGNCKVALKFATKDNKYFLSVGSSVFELNSAKTMWAKYFEYYTDIESMVYTRDTVFVASNHEYDAIDKGRNLTLQVAHSFAPRTGDFFIVGDSLFNIDSDFCWGGGDQKCHLYNELIPNKNPLIGEDLYTSVYNVGLNYVVSTEDRYFIQKYLYFF